MVTANDVATYFIWKANTNMHEDLLTNLKLQKLLYYAQGYHLALYDSPLFEDPIYAWMYGPACPNIYHKYRSFNSNPIIIDNIKLNEVFDSNQINLLDAIYFNYSQYSSWKLTALSCHEKPWLDKHKDVELIDHQTLRRYFRVYSIFN